MSSLEFLIWLENLRSSVTNALLVGASVMGSEEVYMVVLTTIYLCVGHRYGFHLFVMFLASAFLNGHLKEAFDSARPFELYPDSLHPLYAGSGEGGSFPSGHAQNAATVWGIIAIRQRTWSRRAIPLVLIALIAFSRLYCHLHWPADVVGGLLIGGLLVLLYLFLIGAWQASGRRLGLWQGAVVIVATSGLMCLLGSDVKVCVQSSGALLGAGLGFLLLEARGGFKAQAPPLTQVVKVIIALGVLFSVREGAGVALGKAVWAIWAQYAMVGFTCAYVLPKFFAESYNWGLMAGKSMEALQEEDEE